jgi:putative endonuclease
MEKREKQKVGKEGEDFACRFLKKKGWKIIERNFRRTYGELDIVARSSDSTLVFVEVKTTGYFSPGGIQPEHQMTSAKIEKFKKIAYGYANVHQKLFSEEKGFRLDVLALTKVGNDFMVNHYENI